MLRFSPVYGTSWFEMIDYDGDGDDDIVTVNGDNADESYVLKPYHGLRIYLNDGNNHFEEKYFYPFYGATRFWPMILIKMGMSILRFCRLFPIFRTTTAVICVFGEHSVKCL